MPKRIQRWNNQRLGQLPSKIRRSNPGQWEGYFTVDSIVRILRLVRDDYETYITELEDRIAELEAQLPKEK